MQIIFSPRCLEYESAGHPESPRRVKLAAEFLRQKGFDFIEPSACSEDDLLLAHSLTLVKEIKSGDFFDPDTPNIPNIFQYGLLAAGAAIQAQELCRAKRGKVVSLMRPPGHHATRDKAQGFCYFNNLAIAVKKALLKIDKAAILDLDCHHGNGTQDIFYGDERVLYASLHQFPLYPGTGLASKGNCLNYPLRPGSGEEEYLAALGLALSKIMDFQPDLLAISLGFDTLQDDPLTEINLQTASYQKIGRALAEFAVPGFAVLEGGYTDFIGECLDEFMRGWENK